MGESPLQTRGVTYRTVSTARDSKQLCWSRHDGLGAQTPKVRRLERVLVDFVALTMIGHAANAAQPNGHEVQQSGVEGRQADEFLKKVSLCFSAVA